MRLRPARLYTAIALAFFAFHAPGTRALKASSRVTLAPGDILALQSDLLMLVDPVSGARTDYPYGVICSPRGLALTASGELFATTNPHNGCPGSGPGAHGVYRIDTSTGVQTPTSSGGLLDGGLFGIAAGGANLYVAVVSDAGGRIVRIDSQTGAQALVSSDFLLPSGIAVDSAGNLLITDLGSITVSRLNPITGIKTTLAQGGLLAGLWRAGGIAVGPDGAVYVASVDEESVVETGMVVRLDAATGAQTLVSYGQLLVAGNTGITGIAIEPNGNLLVIDRRSSFGIIRIDPGTGGQFGLDIGATPIDGIAVVPAAVSPVTFQGFLEPYAASDRRQFKSGSTIPLKWRFTRDDVAIDSRQYAASLTVNGPVACGTLTGGAAVPVNGTGGSGLQYDPDSLTWQFNWKVPRGSNGCFYVTVDQPALNVRVSLPIGLLR